MLKFRPTGSGFQWSTTGVSWEAFSPALLPVSKRVGLTLSCRTLLEAADAPVERFWCGISVVKEPYAQSQLHMAGHSITLLPPLTIENLLPYSLQYLVTSPSHTTRRVGHSAGNAAFSTAMAPSSSSPSINGELAAGQETAVFDVNLEDELQLSICISGFRWCEPMFVTAAALGPDVETTLRLQDSAGRTLQLYVHNQKIAGSGGCRRLCIFAQYWLINRTGLPLAYKQDSRSALAAGQSTTHDFERLCGPAPFLFSCDGETLSSTGNKCNIRIGNVFTLF